MALIETEKLSVAPDFPLQTLSAWGEEGLTSIIRWCNIGPLVSFQKMVWKHIEIGGAGTLHELLQLG